MFTLREQQQNPGCQGEMKSLGALTTSATNSSLTNYSNWHRTRDYFLAAFYPLVSRPRPCGDGVLEEISAAGGPHAGGCSSDMN